MAFKLVVTKEKSGLCHTTVPFQWEYNGLLRWPTHLRKRELNKLRANPNSKPEEHWTHWECSVEAFSDSFREGRKVEKLLSKSHDTEDEDEEQYMQQIAERKQRVSLTEEKPSDSGLNKLLEDATKENEIDDLPTQNDNEVPSPISDNSLEFSIKSEAYDEDADANETICAMDEQQFGGIQETENKVFVTHEFVAEIRNTMSGILERLEKMENNFVTYMAQTNAKLDKILLNSGEAAAVLSNICGTDLLLQFNWPLDSIQQIEKLNEKLRSDDEFKSQLTSQLTQIGGNTKTADGGKLIYKIIDYLFEPELMTKFSWTGSSKSTEQKISFQKYTGIIDIIFEVIYKADCRHTRRRNEEFLKDKILKHSSQRLDRKRKCGSKSTEVYENRPNNDEVTSFKKDPAKNCKKNNGR